MSWIEKVQFGTITIAAGATSGTASISSVNTAKAFCIFDNFNVNDTTLVVAEDLPRVDLQDSTTVRARTNTANSATARVVPYMVVEGNSLLTSAQQVSINITGTDNSAVISSVDTNYAIVIHNGQTSTSTSDNNWNYSQGRLFLTGFTGVTATRNSSAVGQLNINGAVLEWNSNSVNFVQEVSGTIAAGATTGDATIAAVTDAKAMTFWGGWEINLFASANYQRHPYVHRTSTTNIRGTIGATAATTSLFNVSVVDFLMTPTRKTAGQVAIGSGSATASTTLGASVNRNKTILSWLGQTTDTSGSGNGAIFFSSIALPDSNTVTQTRGATDTMTVTTSWELGEYNDMPAGSLALTGQTLGLKIDQVIPLGSLTLTGLAPSPKNGLPIPLGVLTLDAGATIVLASSYAIPAGSLVLSGKVPVIPAYQEIQPGGSFSGVEIGA